MSGTGDGPAQQHQLVATLAGCAIRTAIVSSASVLSFCKQARQGGRCAQTVAKRQPGWLDVSRREDQRVERGNVTTSANRATAQPVK